MVQRRYLVLMTIMLTLLVILCLGVFYYLVRIAEFKPVVLPAAIDRHEAGKVAVPPNQIVRVLAIDGGGVRGIVPLYALAHLEQITHQPVTRLFDVIVASSSGAIIASALDMPGANGQPKYSAKALIQLYQEQLGNIFKTRLWHRFFSAGGVLGPKFETQNLFEALDRIEGDVAFSQLLKPIAIPAFDLSQRHPVFFTSWGARQTPNKDFRVSSLVAGASAAPGFFAPAFVTNSAHTQNYFLIDGSVVVNTPAFEAYLIAKQLYPHHRYLVVSLGNGGRSSVPELAPQSVARLGFAGWLQLIFPIFFYNQALLTDHNMVNTLLHQENGIVLYRRYSTVLPLQHQGIFDNSLGNIHFLAQAAKAMVSHNQKSFEALGQLLVLLEQQPLSAKLLQSYQQRIEILPFPTSILFA